MNAALFVATVSGKDALPNPSSNRGGGNSGNSILIVAKNTKLTEPLARAIMQSGGFVYVYDSVNNALKLFGS